MGLLATCASAVFGATPLEPAIVQSQQFDIHYRSSASSVPLTAVELWYTENRGRSWHLFGFDADRTSPVKFLTQREGLIGFYLVLRNAYGASSAPPTAGTVPHQQVFVDFTPPVAQLHEARLDLTATNNPRLMLRWSAFDANLLPRPIGLAYRPVGEANWSWIVDRLSNRGRYDWTVPPGLSQPVHIQLTVRDRAGHTVERSIGPVKLDRPKPATTQPGVTPSSAPAKSPLPVVSEAQAKAAAQRYGLGTFHRIRGEHDVAAQMFREALEMDPTHSAARHDLAGVLFKQGDLDQSIKTYQAVLDREPSHPSAYKGLALAYLKRRDYGNARGRLTEHLRLDPNDAHAWLVLGDVARLSGDARAARGYWSKALTVNPNHREMIKRASQRLAETAPPPNRGRYAESSQRNRRSGLAR